MKSYFILNIKRTYRHYSRKKNINNIYGKINDPYSDLYKLNYYGNSFKKLPNKKTKSNEYELIRTSNNTFTYSSPYPPNINYTLKPFPDSAKKFYYENRNYVMRYKNVEYVPIKRLSYKNASKKTNWETYYMRIEK
ncbi:conserved Plasmodium protein, unknown function [Plasmodium berghei]|uniref:Uncharacterized protein n=2 Tax=Plasmodium berghei TaxID=5821 RepID=A0A509AKF3_PLABA|nr:conserved protein, unknown function [Plasmodium berghei ANKA]CXI49273.1 conserved Plasmodium protein, unknown function [Plasmodium berghei]SCL93983.1 conserved Plasmodium protein, unknown function [Plasmodium berghei]SCM15917.1 conserved Plasmodium protein, unknown function [Plasmodium berghei]SCM17713.1 conserved Plasmodium protein, unknown function [Plasmodium berghei]SCN25882.1 conserved Plasmodium protein, unknown function [Plasmodium berghei]|eukprot:XP_034421842.1 conserved protein, unknown function [Plasmodium berghei ANKA]